MWNISQCLTWISQTFHKSSLFFQIRRQLKYRISRSKATRKRNPRNPRKGPTNIEIRLEKSILQNFEKWTISVSNWSDVSVVPRKCPINEVCASLPEKSHPELKGNHSKSKTLTQIGTTYTVWEWFRQLDKALWILCKWGENRANMAKKHQN